MEKKIVCHDVWGKKTEVDSSQLIFRPSVYGILIENDKILLSGEWDGYDIPGGGSKVHETLEESLKREFLEETGLEIEVGDVVHCETFFFHPSHSEKHKNEHWNAPVFYFLVRRVGGEISVNNFSEEEKDYKNLAEWVDLEKIKETKFYNSIDSVEVIKKAEKILNSGLNL